MYLLSVNLRSNLSTIPRATGAIPPAKLPQTPERRAASQAQNFGKSSPVPLFIQYPIVEPRVFWVRVWEDCGCQRDHVAQPRKQVPSSVSCIPIQDVLVVSYFFYATAGFNTRPDEIGLAELQSEL